MVIYSKRILFVIIFCLSTVKSNILANSPAQPSVPIAKQIVLSLDTLFTSPDLSIDTYLIEQEAKNYLLECGVQVVEVAKDYSKNAHNLRIKMVAHRSEDDIYWQALSADYSYIDGLKNEERNDPKDSKPKHQPLQAFHLIAQKGPSNFRSNLLITLQRTISDIAGAPKTALKVEKPVLVGPPARVTVGNLLNVWRILPDKSIPDLRVVNYSQEALKVRKQPPPMNYPPLAKQQGIQGTVVVGIVVNTDGKALIAEALSGPTELLESAIRYALSWEFEPAMLNGKAIVSNFKLTMPFIIK